MVKKGQSPSLGRELSALGGAPAVTTGHELVMVVPATVVEIHSPAIDDTALAIVEAALAPVEAATSIAVIAAPAPERIAPGLLARRAALPPIPPDALSAALLLARRPALVKTARSQPLPADVIMLIRIASNSAETLRRAVHLTGVPRRDADHLDLAHRARAGGVPQRAIQSGRLECASRT